METWIWIFDRDFNQINVLQSYQSFAWEEAYQNRGLFTLIVSDTTENIKFLQEEYFLYMNGKKTAMVIKYRKFDSEKQLIELHGYTTIELIDQRGLLGIKRLTNAERGMREILSDNLRGLPRIDAGENKGYTETFTAQYSNKLILDIFPEVCAGTELGIRMLFDYKNKRHVFDVYKGIDRTFGQSENPTALFNEDFGTLTSTIIVDDASTFKNFAYVFGAGEGVDRIMTEVGTAVGRDRYELFVDARDLQPEPEDPESGMTPQEYQEYIEILKARGVAKLNEHNKRTSFTAEVDGRDFGIKYNLGDKVTCRSKRYGVTLNTRIMQYREVIENNTNKIYLTLGDPEITMIGELKLWLR